MEIRILLSRDVVEDDDGALSTNSLLPVSEYGGGNMCTRCCFAWFMSPCYQTRCSIHMIQPPRFRSNSENAVDIRVSPSRLSESIMHVSLGWKCSRFGIRRLVPSSARCVYMQFALTCVRVRRLICGSTNP